MPTCQLTDFFVGGKWTTYRSMAEDTVNKAVQLHNLNAGPSRTVGLFLQGGQDWSPTLYIRLVQDYGLESEVCGHCQTHNLERLSTSQSVAMVWPP